MNSTIKKEKATGEGELYKFTKDKWQGVCIQYQGIPIHLYAAKEQVDILKGRDSSSFEAIQRVSPVPNVQREIMSQVIQEQRRRDSEN